MKKYIFYFIATLLSSISAFSQVTPVGQKIPSQIGKSGKYLKTVNNKMQWANVTAGLTGSLTANYIPYAFDGDSLANSSIMTYTNGVTVFNSSLDGATSGSSNITHSLTVAGGWRSSFYSDNGYGTELAFYTSNLKKAKIYDNYGYTVHSSAYRWSVNDFNTGNSKMWVDILNNGNVGIGENYFVPTSKLQVVGLAEYADNAAAITAGLTVGAFYRTGDLLKVVH